MVFGTVATTGGSGTPAESFFTPSLPSAVRSAVGETQINIAAATISNTHPFTVSNNAIVIPAGTDDFFAVIDYVLELNPTHWVSDANQGGNRIFLDIYWKQDGTILQDTRISHYIRGDERFAPSKHTLNGVFAELLSPGQYTLHIYRTTASGAGASITGYEIVAANSDIHIVTPGASGSGGASSFTGLTDTPGSFTGQAGKYLRVNTANNALEYVDEPSGLPTGGSSGDFLRRTATSSEWTTLTLNQIGGTLSTSQVPNGFLTPVMLDAGDATKQAAFRTAIGAIASGESLSANSVTAAQARLDTLEHRQEWWHRLELPALETISSQDFTILSGFLSSAGLVGFASTQAGTINGSSTGATFRAGGTLYTVSQIAQTTTAGANLNNILFRVAPDPGDDLTEWDFQIGNVVLSFDDAAKTTVPGGRVLYTWSGNTRLFIGGQTILCSIRIPIAEQFVTAPINFSQIQGTNDPTQFRDNSIAYTRAIAGTPAEQAGWRTKSGFALLANAGNRVLKYLNNQVQQASLDIYDLDNVVPTANLVAPADNQIAIWTVNGLDSVATLGRNHLPPGTATGQVLEWDGTRWTLISTPSGGTGSAASWSTLGRMPSTYANMPSVSAVDNGKFLGVASGAWSLFAPALSSFTGNLPSNRISGRLTASQIPSSLPFTILDLGDATKQSAARTALGITTGSQTIGNSSVSARMLDLYTGTASNSPTSPAKQRTFRHALGVDEDRGYVRYLATLAAGPDWWW